MEQKAALKTKKARVWEIDFIRGVCIILMLLDHLFIFISSLFYASWRGDDFLGKIALWSYRWEKTALRAAIHPYALFFFFFISGISMIFTRKPFITTIKLTIVALLYNLASYLVGTYMNDKSFIVYFGVLNCFAATKIIYCVLFYPWQMIQKQLKPRQLSKQGINVPIFEIILAVIAVASMMYGLHLIETNAHSNGNWWLIFAMPPSRNFYTADYFPIFPYLGYVMAGIIFGNAFYKKRRSLIPVELLERITLPVREVGRRTLLIYIAHIPALFALLLLISTIAGKALPI